MKKTSKPTGGSRKRSRRRPRPNPDALAVLAVLLAKLGLRWYVFGAQAVNLHGYPRATADLDVKLDPGELPVAELVRNPCSCWSVDPVLSIENLIVTKILAGRPRDLEDARELVARGSPDHDKVDKTLAALEGALRSAAAVRRPEGRRTAETSLARNRVRA